MPRLGLGASLTGGVSLEAFVNTAYVTLDGSNDYIDCGDDTSLDITTAGSISCWFKPAAINQQVDLISKDDGTNRNFWVFLQNDEKVYWTIVVGGTAYNAISETTYSTSWMHMVGTYDGETSKLYIDGSLEKSNTSPSGSIDNDDVSLTIGAREDGADRNFNGSMDEVAIFSKELSAAEVSTLYGSDGDPINAGNARDISSLEGYWRFEEGSGTSVVDSSDNSNTGTLVNDVAWATH